MVNVHFDSGSFCHGKLHFWNNLVKGTMCDSVIRINYSFPSICSSDSCTAQLSQKLNWDEQWKSDIYCWNDQWMHWWIHNDRFRSKPQCYKGTFSTDKERETPHQYGTGFVLFVRHNRGIAHSVDGLQGIDYGTPWETRSLSQKERGKKNIGKS